MDSPSTSLRKRVLVAYMTGQRFIRVVKRDVDYIPTIDSYKHRMYYMVYSAKGGRLVTDGNLYCAAGTWPISYARAINKDMKNIARRGSRYDP